MMKLYRGKSWSDRRFWLRSDIEYLFRRARGAEGQGYPVRREFGGWAVRPVRGWRRIRWVTPPMHYTRTIPGDDTDAALEWAMQRMGV